MAEIVKSNPVASKSSISDTHRSAINKAREINSAKLKLLGEDQKVMLSVARGARRTVDRLIVSILNGDIPSANSMQACTMLTGEALQSIMR